MSERTQLTQPAGVTLHLTPREVWQAHESLAEYRPEGFAADGFIHCTDDEALVIEVGNRYYRGDPRPYVLLEVDLALVRAPAIYEDDERRFPHIYGPIECAAVARVRRVERASDGTFLGIDAWDAAGAP